MDENIVVVNTTINEFARKQATGFKKEYQKVGQSFRLLAQAFELDQQSYSAGLNRAIAGTGEAYETIGDYFAEQPRQDLDPISDLLDLYRGHLANFPDIIHVQKGGISLFLSHTRTFLQKVQLWSTKEECLKFFTSRCEAIAAALRVFPEGTEISWNFFTVSETGIRLVLSGHRGDPETPIPPHLSPLTGRAASRWAES